MFILVAAYWLGILSLSAYRILLLPQMSPLIQRCCKQGWVRFFSPTDIYGYHHVYLSLTFVCLLLCEVPK